MGFEIPLKIIGGLYTVEIKVGTQNEAEKHHHEDDVQPNNGNVLIDINKNGLYVTLASADGKNGFPGPGIFNPEGSTTWTELSEQPQYNITTLYGNYVKGYYGTDVFGFRTSE